MNSEPMYLTRMLSQLRNLTVTWRRRKSWLWMTGCALLSLLPGDSLDCEPRTVWPGKPADTPGGAGAGRGVPSLPGFPVGTRQHSLPGSGIQAAWLGVFFCSSPRLGWFKLLSGGPWPSVFFKDFSLSLGRFLKGEPNAAASFLPPLSQAQPWPVGGGGSCQCSPP